MKSAIFMNTSHGVLGLFLFYTNHPCLGTYKNDWVFAISRETSGRSRRCPGNELSSLLILRIYFVSIIMTIPSLCTCFTWNIWLILPDILLRGAYLFRQILSQSHIIALCMFHVKQLADPAYRSCIHSLWHTTTDFSSIIMPIPSLCTCFTWNTQLISHSQCSICPTITRYSTTSHANPISSHYACFTWNIWLIS